MIISCREPEFIALEAANGFRHPLPAFGQQCHPHPGARRSRSKINANFRSPSPENAQFMAALRLSTSTASTLGQLDTSIEAPLSEQVAEIKGVAAAEEALLSHFRPVVPRQRRVVVSSRRSRDFCPSMQSCDFDRSSQRQSDTFVSSTCVIGDDCNRRLKRESAREYAQPVQYLPFLLIKKVITPLQRRVQRLMPRHGRSTPSPRQIQVTVQQACGLAEAINIHPACREFDCQGNTVQPPANSGGNRRVDIARSKCRCRAWTRSTNNWTAGYSRASDAQDSLIFRRASKRGEFVHVFPLDPQCLPAGREQVQRWHMGTAFQRAQKRRQ